MKEVNLLKKLYWKKNFSIVLLIPDTIPSDIVFDNPIGLPIAYIFSPLVISSESPDDKKGKHYNNIMKEVNLLKKLYWKKNLMIY